MGRNAKIYTDFRKGDLVVVRDETWHNRHINLLVRIGVVTFSTRNGHIWKPQFNSMSKYFGSFATIVSISRNWAYLSCNSSIFPFHMCQLDHYQENQNESIEDI